MAVDPPDHKQQEALWLEAVELLEARGDAPELAARLAAFQKRSAAHRDALRRAKQYLQAAPTLSRRQSTPWRNTKYQAQLWTARATQPPVAAALGLFACAVLVWLLLPRDTALEPVPAVVQTPAFTQSIKTAWQEQRALKLPDGTTVWLNWQSALTAHIDDNTRNVTLTRGSAAFKVAQDSTRPFVVEANDVSVRVTGTEFVVHLETSDQIAVDVLEGSVSVRTGASSASLGAEQRVVATSGLLGPVQLRSLEEMGSWREGMLVFKQRPLMEALNALEDYLPYSLDTQLLRPEGRQVTGVYFTDEAEKGLAAILESHRLEAQPIGTTMQLRERRPERPER